VVTSNNNSVIIIGAGIVGLCCAWELQAKGFEVSIIDTNEAGSQTSYGNAATISPTKLAPYSHPAILKDVATWLVKPNNPLSIRWKNLAHLFPWLSTFIQSGKRENLDEQIKAIAALMSSCNQDWDNLIKAIDGQHLIAKKGVIKLFSNKQDLKKHQWQIDLATQNGYEHTLYQGVTLNELEPHLKSTEQMQGLYFKDWQHLLDPNDFCQYLAKALREHGVIFLKDKINSLERSSEDLMLNSLNGKSYKTNHCIVAAGIWSNHLSQQFSESAQMVAKRGYHLNFNQPNFTLNHPILPMQDYCLITPLESNGNHQIRVAGQAEFDAIDEVADYQRTRHLIAPIKKYFPELKIEHTSEWMGQRPMTSDSLPVISQSAKCQNLYYAFGHGHYGITQGPTTGRLITEMITDQVSTINIDPYSIKRFKSA